MKKMLCIVFLALLSLAWLVSVSGMISRPKEYADHIARAKELDEKGIYIDAVEEYKAALEMKPEETWLQMRIADDYLKIHDTSSYVSTLKQVIDKGGEEAPAALDELMNYYISSNYASTALKYVKGKYQQNPDAEYFKTWYVRLKGTFEYLFFNGDEAGGMYNGFCSFVSKGKSGMLDKTGSKVLDPNYEMLEPYIGEGYFQTVRPDGRIIYIDSGTLTRVVLDADITSAGIMANSRISAAKNGKFGYLDEKGSAVCDFVYDALSGFQEVGAAKKGSTWALVDDKGGPITDFLYEDVALDEYGIACKAERLFIKYGGSWRMINTLGETIGNLSWENAKPFTSAGYAAVCKNGKWGFVDTEGNEVIPCTYDDARSFVSGHAAVKTGDLWGYIDTENRLVIEGQFLEATDFSSSGIAAVKVRQEATKYTDAREYWTLIKLVNITL